LTYKKSDEPPSSIFNEDRISYLNKIVEFPQVGVEKYVDLLIKENIYSTLEQIGIELIENPDFIIDDTEEYEIGKFSFKEESQSDEKKENQTFNRKIDYISEIARTTHHFVLIGDPGSGKTTALRRICYDIAKKILDSNDSTIKTPVFIESKYYERSTNNFIKIISSKLNTSISNTNSSLKNGELQILIDGINEIDSIDYEAAIKEINLMLEDYYDCSFVISSRKTGYNNIYQIPEFELQELNEIQVKSYLNNYSTNGKAIWQFINEDSSLKKLAFNPMILYMITYKYSKENKLPKNKGDVFNFFTRNIIANEYYKNEVKYKRRNIDKDTFLNSLISLNCSISYNLKVRGSVKSKINQLNSIIEDTLIKPIEAIDNPMINIKEDSITYSHESFLDYYSGLYIADFIIKEGITYPLDAQDANLPRWHEPILFCGDILALKKDSSYSQYINILTFGESTKHQKTLTIPKNEIKAHE